MPIARVQDSNGVIHRIEVPDGATPQEVEAFAAQSIGSNIEPPKAEAAPVQQTAGQTASISAVSGLPFGKDIAAGIGAAIYGRDTGTSFTQRYDAAKRFFDQQSRQAMTQNPALAIPATIGGALLTAPLMPAKFIQMGQGGTIAGRALGGAAQGMTSGAIYGAGEGLGSERVTNAIESGIFGGAIGAAAAPIAAGVSSTYQAAKNWLAKNVTNPQALSNDVVVRFAALLEQNPQAAQSDDTMAQLARNLQSTTVDDTLQPGGVLSLTKGQATQKPELQSLEQQALRMGLGEENAALMQAVRQKQSDEARAVIKNIAATEITPETKFIKSGEAATQVREAHKIAKAATSQAYEDVARLNNGNPVKIANAYGKGIADRFDEIVNGADNQTGFDLLGRGMEEGKRLYSQFKDMASREAMDFQAMEQWRGRVSQAISTSQVKPERAFLGRMIDTYDRAMERLPTSAILSGDIKGLNAMEKARGLRKAQGVLFERNKAIKEILDNNELTNEELANVFLSASSNKYGARTARMVQSALRAVGDKKPELQQRFKAGYMAKILNRSLMDEVGADGVQRISFDKLGTNLKEYIYENPTLFRTIHSDLAERDAIIKFYKDVQLIKSMQPGTVNYSNTAMSLMNALQKVSPMISGANIAGAGIGSVLKSIAQDAASVDLRQSLAPVMKQAIQELNAQPFIYGAAYGSGAVAKPLLESE